ncbi:unnamed protein product [Taenia asiatica]|uniref:RNF111_N domain-containing protein n=1 Tax=Taenia asiatica TaxID=60517 RepID=A0A0R3VZ87_TAEAS|nr:unnamed protein product [Taenia asiatica]
MSLTGMNDPSDASGVLESTRESSLVERPESPHLSVISEASTDESALEKQNSIDGKLQNTPLEVSGVEGHDDYSEWKTVTPKKTRSRRNGKAERKRQEEDGETKGLPYSLPESSIHPENGNEHAVLTPTQTSCGVEDGNQGTQPQEGDSEEDTDKTISETEPSEVRERENESAKSSQVSVKSLSHPVGDFTTEVVGKEPSILEDSGNSALMRDVQPLWTQLKSQRSPIAETVDVDGSQKNSEQNESQGSEEGECNTTPTPSECQVSRVSNDTQC